MAAYHAKKRLGQNFLKTGSVIDRVVALAEAGPGDRIIEVGAGRGALTLPLADSDASVWAVEFDRDLIGYLSSLLSDFDKVEVISRDFLTFDPAAVGLDSFKLIGNLPYNITSPVIDWCLRYHDCIESAVLMVQKELGARLAASPGCKDWSPLSVFAQTGFRVEHCFDVDPRHFHPAPQVKSAVLRLTPITTSQHRLTPRLQRLVRTSFKQRRKTLLNNLVPELIEDPGLARRILSEVSLEAGVRAEAVTIEQFLNLTARLVEYKLI